MTLLSGFDFTLPLTHPVIVFSLVLFIILFAPIILNKIKVPHIIGLILSGVAVGPYGFNLLSRDASIVLFGTVGLLYIMFLAGLEIDITEFKKSKFKILYFGLSTFLFPLTIGSLAGYYILGYDLLSAMLLACMICSHTLISFPIVSRYGISKQKAVTLSIGATMVTDTLALLLLAVIAGSVKEEVSTGFWLSLTFSTLSFVAIVFLLFPLLIRWFFKNFQDSVSQYIFVLAVVFLASFMAQASGLEAIIGAFFSGLVLNKFIPHSSPLMSRINFVGNALFIPFFLISVGMLVDLSVLFKGWGALKVIGVLVTASFLGKFSAAWSTRKLFGLSYTEGRLMYGLSASHAAATLAIVLVGFNIIIGETATGEPIRLLNEDVLNAAVILILISCTTSSFVVERAARKLALVTEKSPTLLKRLDERILVSLSRLESAWQMVDLGMMLKASKTNSSVYALHIITDDATEFANHTQAAGQKMIQQALDRASATDDALTPISRYDMNVTNGVIYTIKEQQITDIVIEAAQNAAENGAFEGSVESLIRNIYETIFIYRPVQPLNTLKRMVVAVAPRAELEPGFSHWFMKTLTIAAEAAVEVVYYATPQTIIELSKEANRSKAAIKTSYLPFSNWDDFLIFSREVKPNDLFVVVTSRKGNASYHPFADKLFYYLSNYFTINSFIILYPKQLEQGVKMDDVQHVDGSLIDTLSEGAEMVGKAGNYIKKLFRKDESN